MEDFTRELKGFTAELDDHREDLSRHYRTLTRFGERFFRLADREEAHAKRSDIVKLHQEELNGFKTLIEEHTKTAESLRECSSKIESKISEYLSSQSEEGYEKKLLKTIEKWKEIAEKDSTERGKKSFIEWKKMLDSSDKDERKIFNVIKILAIDLGTEISRLLVEYFLFFADSERQEVTRRLEFVKRAIQSESLAESSSVIDRFVSVVELIEREIANRPQKRGERARNFEANGFNEGIEYSLLDKIFHEVISLELAFFHPFFPNLSAKKEVLLDVGDKIKDMFMSKLKEISLTIDAMKMRLVQIRGEDSELKKLKEVLVMAIEKLWNELDLKLGT